jgi:hypothetical protein
LETRRNEGSETWHRLLAWDRGQAPSQRLTAHILREEGFNSIDPIHPLGGLDGAKDVICERDGKKWIAAAYFPRGQQTFHVIKKKLRDDLKDIDSNNVDGVVFVTNQELKLSERQQLKGNINEGIEIEIFHLERIASILDRPRCYAFRLDYLDIAMTKEEQFSFMAEFSAQVEDLNVKSELMLALINKSESLTAEFHAALEKIYKHEPISNQKIVEAVLLTRIRPFGLQARAEVDLHKCSKCDFGFLFQIQSSYSINSIYRNGLNSELGVVCTKCGNADKILIPLM